MHRILIAFTLVSGLLLAASARGDVVIDMPAPSKPKSSTTEVGAAAEASRQTDAGRLALARYAGHRIGPRNTWSSLGWQSGYARPYSSGYAAPFAYTQWPWHSSWYTPFGIPIRGCTTVTTAHGSFKIRF